LKLLLEGSPIKVCAKTEQDEIMERTPFFLTSNELLGKWVEPFGDLGKLYKKD